jgi:hypothetical protein
VISDIERGESGNTQSQVQQRAAQRTLQMVQETIRSRIFGNLENTDKNFVTQCCLSSHVDRVHGKAAEYITGHHITLLQNCVCTLSQ